MTKEELGADPALLGTAQRAAKDGQDRFLLVVRSAAGGTMTYGTVYSSAGAASDDATTLRHQGRTGQLFLLDAKPDGTVSVQQVAA
jgi:hypothetical protein